MSAAVAQPLNDIIAGESRTFRVTARDENGAIAPVDGASLIEFEVQDKVGDVDTPLIAKSLGSGIEFVTDGTDGEFDITLLPGDTDPNSSIAPGSFVYDVVVVIAGKRSYVIPASEFTVSGAVNPP